VATGQLMEYGRGWLRLGGIPVFLYHGLTKSGSPKGTGRERKYWISRAQFHEQLSCIRREGYEVALLTEGLKSNGRLKERSSKVSLTFDDGRRSDYECAFPSLLEAGMRAEFFVNTAHIGTEGFLSWPQMAEMQRAGMSFQSHGHEHVDLSRLPANELERQLKLSKQMLEDRLGQSVDFLAVPFGRQSDQLLEKALQVGYRALCNSRNWPAQAGSRIVNRVSVYAHTTLSAFQRLLTGNPLSYATRAAREMLLYAPKGVLWRFQRQQFDAAPLGDPT
jgi:peptidoglycan/xylan/chitin deacetylase (PgdA/CDA1 family)